MAATRMARGAGVATEWAKSDKAGRVSALLLAAQPAVTAAAASTITEQCMVRLRGHFPQLPYDLDHIGQLRLICYQILRDEETLRLKEVGTNLFRNQTFQNHVLLYTVVFITVAGVLLAGIQLLASYRLAQAAGAPLTDGGGDLTLEPGKVAVKSSVVGVLILALSLAFFSIYVTQVHRITPEKVSTGSGEPVSTSGEMPQGEDPTLEASRGNASGGEPAPEPRGEGTRSPR